MTRVEFSRTAPTQDWNDRVRSTADGTLFQTSHWARFCKRYFGIEALYLLAVGSSGEVQGQLLFFDEPVGYRGIMFERPLSWLTLPLMRRLIPSFRWQFGPLIFVEGEENRRAVCEAILDYVQAFATARRGLSIESSGPPIHGCDAGEFIPVFEDRGYSVRIWNTFLVDLRVEPDELWTRLERSARKSVRRAQDQGVSVQRVKDLAELRLYYDFAVSQEANRRGRMFSFDNMAVMWDVLREHAGVEFFVAVQGERMLGGLGVWVYNGLLTEFWVARSDHSVELRMYEGDLIRWEIIRWGHASGHRVYDLAGVAPDPVAGSKEAGIFRFKKKWGGKLHSYPLMDRSLPGVVPTLAQVLRRVRSPHKSRGYLRRPSATEIKEEIT